VVAPAQVLEIFLSPLLSQEVLVVVQAGSKTPQELVIAHQLHHHKVILGEVPLEVVAMVAVAVALLQVALRVEVQLEMEAPVPAFQLHLALLTQLPMLAAAAAVKGVTLKERLVLAAVVQVEAEAAVQLM
jgi:hypothetical protein